MAPARRADGAVHPHGIRQTVIVELSDASSYEGGGTRYIDDSGDVVIRQGRGTCAVHDGSVWHAGHSVTHGRRVVLVAQFLVGPNVIDARPHTAATDQEGAQTSAFQRAKQVLKQRAESLALQRANQVLVPAKAARLPQCRSMAKTADGGEEGTVMDAVASTLMYCYRQISRAYLGPRVQVLVA